MGDRTGLPRIDRTNGYEDGRGYMREKKSKLAQQNEQIRDALRQRHGAMRTELLKGISINVNGRTQPTADELKRLVLLNGGEYHPYYRYQQTKFMIATNLSTARIKTLRPDDKIVKPEWIVDSVKANCVLPYQDYQLFADEPRGKRGQNRPLALESDNSNHSLTNHSITSNSNNNNNKPQATIQQLLQANAAAAKANASAANISSTTSNTNASEVTITKTTIAAPTTSTRSISGRSSQTASTSFTNNNNNNKKQPTMNDFVVRGLAKANHRRFPTPKVQQQPRDVANIIGHTNIDDIVKLINEWIGCPEGVTDEDVACVTKYFYDLMGEKDYHNKFCEVMDAFRQRVTDHGEKCWIDLYNDLARTFKNELSLNAEASQNLSVLITYIEPKKEDQVNDAYEFKEPSQPREEPTISNGHNNSLTNEKEKQADNVLPTNPLLDISEEEIDID